MQQKYLHYPGSDQWRVTHESDGHVETDYAAPGEYGAISTLINNGIITEIEKVCLTSSLNFHILHENGGDISQLHFKFIMKYHIKE